MPISSTRRGDGHRKLDIEAEAERLLQAYPEAHTKEEIAAMLHHQQEVVESSTTGKTTSQ